MRKISFQLGVFEGEKSVYELYVDDGDEVVN